MLIMDIQDIIQIAIANKPQVLLIAGGTTMVIAGLAMLARDIRNWWRAR